MRVLHYFILACVMVSLVGCSTTKVKRVDVDETIDLSGQWNDKDALLVAEEMVRDCLARPWRTHFMKKKGRNPVVIVGLVKNSSHEHINTAVFTKYLERELLNSGEVSFVAAPDERGQLRQEREDQKKGYTAQETIAQFGRERGADYMLIGSVNTVKDAVKRKYVILYQANLELVNLTTNEKVWIGQKHIKKSVKKAKYGW